MLGAIAFSRSMIPKRVAWSSKRIKKTPFQKIFSKFFSGDIFFILTVEVMPHEIESREDFSEIMTRAVAPILLFSKKYFFAMLFLFHRTNVFLTS
jgi:hypothetical protein